MIPSGLILATSTTATTFTSARIHVEEGKTATRYLAFYDTSFASSFTLRKRQRVRPSDSDEFGAWGDWSEWTETIAAEGNGLRRSLTPFTWDTTDVSPASTNDLIELEFQAQEAGGEWSASFMTTVVYKPTLTLTATLSGVSSITLSLDTGAWTRNGSTLTIQDIKQGSTTDPLSALPSMLKSKPIVFGGLEPNPARDIDLNALSLFPGNNTYMSVTFKFSTCDICVNRYTVPLLVTYTASNTPTAVLVPNHDAGTVTITVTDAGGAKPITGCSALMLGGMGAFDLIPLTVGVAATHYVPPLGKQITYQIIAVAADGSRKVVEKSTTVKSGGRNWFNWGANYSESMELRANVEWDVKHAKDKTYFKPYEGLPKVFHAKTKETDGAASAVVFSKTYHAKAESLTAADKVVYRDPNGNRRVISIDSTSIKGSAKQVYLNVGVKYTEVSPWQ